MVRAEYEMKVQGFTVTRLAEVVGCHRMTLSKILCGKERPRPYLMAAIATALNWQGDPADLMREVEVI